MVERAELLKNCKYRSVCQLMPSQCQILARLNHNRAFYKTKPDLREIDLLMIKESFCPLRDVLQQRFEKL
jgi:hypothetical protein